MILYWVCMVAFLILLKTRSALRTAKEKEIAILRSIGYAIKDIIALKFIQNTVVALSAFLLGVWIAYMYVFIFKLLCFERFLGSQLGRSVSLRRSWI